MAVREKIRKCIYQNPSSGKIYEVVYKMSTAGAIAGRGVLLGTNKINDDPRYDNTEVAFVVLTANVADVFGVAAKHESYLATAAIYDASNPAAGGALLSTLLV